MGSAHPPVRSGPPGPPVRLVPAPRTEPPYEDEPRGAALPGQLLLPWARSTPPGSGPRAPRDDASGRRARDRDAHTGRRAPGTAAPAALEARLAAWHFATRYAEIVDGRRAAGHLRTLSDPAAAIRLSADALRAREHLRTLTTLAHPGGGRAGRRPRSRGEAAAALTNLHVQLVRSGVAEAVALLRLRGVVRALAFRMERQDPGWRVTTAELIVAGARQPARA